jgi:gamma-D-glutamyl-L-lysine dipeptidyl-peptidase
LNYAVCQVSISPVRAQASDKSEMVSQLLFGETVEVHESNGPWRRIVCSWDQYQGWVDEKQLYPLTTSEFENYKDKSAINLSLVEGLMAADHFIPLTMGASLPNYDGIRLEMGEKTFQFSGPVVTPGLLPPNGDWIIKLAKRYLHAPYLWGGRSPFGIDCSGLTQIVFKMAGIPLLRDASQQVMQGRPVDFMQQCQAGDLAFFENSKGNISHVGIMLSDCNIIHASGRVRMDKVDHFGIFNKEMNKYSHQLRVVRRFLPDAPIVPDEKPEFLHEQNIEVENQISLF